METRPSCPPELHALLTSCLRALEEHRHARASELAGAARDLAVNIGVLPYAQTLVLSGLVDGRTGRPGSADTMLTTAFSLTTRHLDSPDGVRLHLCAGVELACLRRSRGQLAGAEQVLTHTLAATAHTDRSPEELGLIHLELGTVLTRSGRLDQATECSGLAWRLLASLLPDDDLMLATIYRNRGGLAHARGDHNAAERAARRALGLRVQTLGADHPDVAGDCAALAASLLALGRLEEAEGHLRRALTVFARTQGTGHPDYAVSLGNLAAVVHRRGHHLAADTLYRRALRGLERTRGLSHPDLWPVRANLAQLHRDLNVAGVAGAPAGPPPDVPGIHASYGTRSCELPCGDPNISAGSHPDALQRFLGDRWA